MSNGPTKVGGRRRPNARNKPASNVKRLQRQMASKKRNRTIGIALVALAAVAVIAAVVVLRPGDTSAALPAPSTLLGQAADEAGAAACDAVQTTGFYDGLSPRRNTRTRPTSGATSASRRYLRSTPTRAHHRRRAPTGHGDPPGRRVRLAALGQPCCTPWSTGAPSCGTRPTRRGAGRRDHRVLRPERPRRAGSRDRGALRLPRGAPASSPTACRWRSSRGGGCSSARSRTSRWRSTSPASTPSRRPQDREYAGEAPERGAVMSTNQEQEDKNRRPSGVRPERGPAPTDARPDGNAERRARKEQARQTRAAERKRTRSAFAPAHGPPA